MPPPTAAATPPPTRPCRRGHRHAAYPVPVAPLVALLLLLMPFLAACGSATAAAPRQPATASAAAAPAPQPRTGKVCVDPTTSSANDFAPAVLAAIARQILALVPDVPPHIDAAQPARPDVTVELRSIATHSNATDGTYLRVRVSGVDALPAPPALDDPDYTSHASAWTDEQTAWQVLVTTARQAATKASVDITNFPLDRKTNSGVLDCVAAFSTAGARAAGTPILLASDLLDTASHSGLVNDMDLAGAPVYLVLSCPTGSEAACPQRAGQFEQLVRQHHAGDVQVYRAEQVDEAVSAWLGGTR